MWVLIDIDSHGCAHMIDTDPATAMPVGHPDGSGQTTIDVFLEYLNVHPDAREKAGWNVMNQLPGESEPITRWHRLIYAVSQPSVDVQAKSLGLNL